MDVERCNIRGWVTIVVAVVCLAGCSSDDGDRTENGGDAGEPSYPCLTTCDPSADAGACENFEECHDTGSGGYCVPSEDVIVPEDVVQERYSCLNACDIDGSRDAGSACRVPENCEVFNDRQSFCVPAEVPCGSGEVAVSEFGCVPVCDPGGQDTCSAGSECRELQGLGTGACLPVTDAG